MSIPAGAVIPHQRLSVISSDSRSPNSGSMDLTSPQVGDIAIAVDYCVNTDSATLPTATTVELDTGAMSLLVDASGAPGGGNGSRCRIYVREVAAGDISGGLVHLSTWMNDNDEWQYAVLVRPARKASAISLISSGGQITTNNPTLQTAAVAGQTVPVFILAMYQASLAVSPRTFSPAEDFEDTSLATNFYIKYKIYNSNPQDTSIDMDDEERNGLAHIALAVG